MADTSKTETPKPVVRWGDLNVALNALVREGVISSYKSNRAEKSEEPSIEVAIPNGADQAEVVGRVRSALPPAFEGATVRTRKA